MGSHKNSYEDRISDLESVLAKVLTRLGVCEDKVKSGKEELAKLLSFDDATVVDEYLGGVSGIAEATKNDIAVLESRLDKVLQKAEKLISDAEEKANSVK